MPLAKIAQMRIPLAIVLAVSGMLLSSCVSSHHPEYTRLLTATANPLDVQTGRLTVIALDLTDGGPLYRATVDVVAADGSIDEPNYYRRVGVSDRSGMVTFSDVPRRVSVSITHSRGTYSRDGYVVPQTAQSEFRVYVETTGARTRDECLSAFLCN